MGHYYIVIDIIHCRFEYHTRRLFLSKKMIHNKHMQIYLIEHSSIISVSFIDIIYSVRACKSNSSTYADTVLSITRVASKGILHIMFRNCKTCDFCTNTHTLYFPFGYKLSKTFLRNDRF